MQFVDRDKHLWVQGKAKLQESLRRQVSFWKIFSKSCRKLNLSWRTWYKCCVLFELTKRSQMKRLTLKRSVFQSNIVKFKTLAFFSLSESECLRLAFHFHPRPLFPFIISFGLRYVFQWSSLLWNFESILVPSSPAPDSEFWTLGRVSRFAAHGTKFWFLFDIYNLFLCLSLQRAKIQSWVFFENFALYSLHCTLSFWISNLRLMFAWFWLFFHPSFSFLNRTPSVFCWSKS